MSKLLELIDAEIANLQQARAAIASAPSLMPVKRKPGRPAKVTAAPTAKPKRGISPEGRARIAAAMKARWAKKKAAAK